ncbi:hypothetical protein Tco_1524698 [Tanacetum coccineum]
MGTSLQNVINDSALDDPEVCRSKIDQLASPGFFSQLHGMDYDQLFTEFNVGAARQTCLCVEVRLRSEHNYRGRKKFERKCQRQTDLLKEKDAEIASLKAQLSLKEAEATKAIHLRGQVSVAETTKSARVSELNSFKEQNSVLEEEKGVLDGKVTALESVVVAKETELASLTTQTAKLTQDLSSLQLSFNELSIKASSLESQRDGLIDQVSSLETACSVLRDQVSNYEIFKEHIEAVQDEQIKVLNDRVAELDSDLMGMAVHLDEEFYPRFLTTIVGRRWIISRGFRLAVMKCLQSSEYVAALGAAIGLAIDKGMQTGLVAGIDHRKAGRGLAEKDASIADIMDSLRLEGPSPETPKVSQLQPAYEQLLLPIHRKEDTVVIGETSLSDSLTVVLDRVQKVKEGALSHRLSISEAMGPLVDPLSSENLIGEASTSGVPVAAATTTALSTTFAHTSSVPPISVTDYDVLYTEARPKASHSP